MRHRSLLQYIETTPAVAGAEDHGDEALVVGELYDESVAKDMNTFIAELATQIHGQSLTRLLRHLRLFGGVPDCATPRRDDSSSGRTTVIPTQRRVGKHSTALNDWVHCPARACLRLRTHQKGKRGGG